MGEDTDTRYRAQYTVKSILYLNLHLYAFKGKKMISGRWWVALFQSAAVRRKQTANEIRDLLPLPFPGSIWEGESWAGKGGEGTSQLLGMSPLP